MTSWMIEYCLCVQDMRGGVWTEDALRRDRDFRNGVYRRAGALSFPACHFRPAETVPEGMDTWAVFTARGDIHALADAMLELDGIEYAAWRRKEGAA